MTHTLKALAALALTVAAVPAVAQTPADISCNDYLALDQAGRIAFVTTLDEENAGIAALLSMEGGAPALTITMACEKDMNKTIREALSEAHQ